MALIKCPECGKEISDKATACVNCGLPINAEIVETTLKNAKYFKIILTSYQSYRKVALIHALHTELYIGVAEAKKAVESTPAELATGLTEEECNRLKVAIEKADGTVEIQKDNLICEHNDFFKDMEHFKSTLPKYPICPKCKSASITISKRGFTFFGLLGKKTVSIFCPSCGLSHTFKA